MSRIEEYLTNCCEMCGCDGLPQPISNTDKLLYHLAEQLAKIGNGTGGGGGGVSSWNDLTDKPFYSETVEVLPETTVEIDPEMSAGFIPGEFTFVGGKKYTVKYNGVEYVTSCLEMGGEFGLGNLGAIGETLPITEEPFCLAYVDMGDGIMGLMVAALDGSASVTLSVIGEKVKQIEKKYLPNINVVIDADVRNGATWLDMDTTDIVDAILNDNPIFVNLITAVNNRNGTERAMATPFYIEPTEDAGKLTFLTVKDYVRKMLLVFDASSIPLQLNVYSARNNKSYDINIVKTSGE